MNEKYDETIIKWVNGMKRWQECRRVNYELKIHLAVRLQKIHKKKVADFFARFRCDKTISTSLHEEKIVQVHK